MTPLAEKDDDKDEDMGPPRWVCYDDARVLGWGSAALVILVWEVSARISGVSPLYLPRPTQIVVALIEMFRNGALAMLAARDLGATQQQIVRKVLLPSAIPSIFAGIRLGLGVSIILVVAAEMVVGKLGLGARLYLSGQILETEQVFAVLIVLASLGIVVTKTQDWIDKKLGRWRLA